MSSIRFADVAFAYPQQSSLITACTLDFQPGWTGIVGRNGEGKSTLLDLIDGTIQPVTGRVERGDDVVARCRQSPTSQSCVEPFALAWTSAALRWMSLLGLDPDDYWRWDTLSPGTRRRWQIGSALFIEPGVLLLDEPTNHLDTAGRELLCDALRRFRGVGVVVSHDRVLLDALCGSIVRIHSTNVATYPGSYSAAREHWLADQASSQQELEAAQARERALESQLAARSTRHAASNHGLNTRSRMTSVRDHDARSTAAKGRAANAEQAHARAKSVTRAELERAREALVGMARPPHDGSSITLDGGTARREVVLRFDGPVAVGDRLLAPHVELALGRGERRWLHGPNGCGKTTLLRALLAASDLDPQRVLWLDQQLDIGAVRSKFAKLGPDERSRALQIGSAMCLNARAVLDGTPLSPGEVRKLALSVGLVAEPWLLVLDEPTNDLDLDTIERLEQALCDYAGALLLVTHDLMFAMRLDARPWTPFGSTAPTA